MYNFQSINGERIMFKNCNKKHGIEISNVKCDIVICQIQVLGEYRHLNLKKYMRLIHEVYYVQKTSDNLQQLIYNNIDLYVDKKYISDNHNYIVQIMDLDCFIFHFSKTNQKMYRHISDEIYNNYNFRPDDLKDLIEFHYNNHKLVLRPDDENRL